jgi:iron uptake system component EfeO
VRHAGWLVLFAIGCSCDPERDATLDTKAYIDEEIAELWAASRALCEAAPPPDADGWSAREDRAAIARMRAAWLRARVAYEHIEGAIAVLFPHIDRAVDGRYDHALELRADPDPFDREGFTGMHAIERILWAGEHPPQVVAFESGLEHYVAARMPEDEAEARAFRDQLCARLVADVSSMREQYTPLALDPSAAYDGVVGSMAEQFEKVQLAATGEDESRYSQLTLADIRANLEGGRRLYACFQGWIRDRPGGDEVDARVIAGFARLERLYGELPGDELPPVPDGFTPDRPSSAHLRTPYGRLFRRLRDEASPEREGSLVAAMREAADLMGIPLSP